MEKKIAKHFDDYGFGFQVRILNAPMIKLRGEWVLDVDQQKLRRSLLRALVRKPVRLTGLEIRFIRTALEMTLAEFGAKFDVSHPAVIKWEKAGKLATDMSWSTEKDIRLYTAFRTAPKPADFLAIYEDLSEKAEPEEMLVKIDAKKVA